MEKGKISTGQDEVDAAINVITAFVGYDVLKPQDVDETLDNLKVRRNITGFTSDELRTLRTHAEAAAAANERQQILAAFDSVIKDVLERERREYDANQRAEMEREERTRNFTQLATNFALAISVVGALVGAFWAIYNNFLSEEALERDRQQNIAFEQNNLLGFEASVVSANGCSVALAPQGVTYVESGDRISIKPGDNLEFPVYTQGVRDGEGDSRVLFYAWEQSGSLVAGTQYIPELRVSTETGAQQQYIVAAVEPLDASRVVSRPLVLVCSPNGDSRLPAETFFRIFMQRNEKYPSEVQVLEVEDK